MSDPIVVDSPIENTAVETAPTIESLLEPKPVAKAATPVTDGIEPPPSEKQAAAEATDDSAAQIQQLSESVGRDLSRFKTVEAAQAAADMIIEQYAMMGGDSSGDVVPAEPAPAKTAEELDDLGLDEATVDPAVIAAFKKLRSENKELKTSFAASQQKAEQQRQAAFLQQTEQRAESYLDKLDAPIFGKSGKRTAAQNAASQVVGNIAGNILRGVIAETKRTGKAANITIEQIMAAAVKQTGFAVEKKAAEPAKAKPHSLAPKSGASKGGGGGMPRVAAQNDPYGIFDKPDATIQAIWQEFANGG